jgi:tRNA uracil 4-sulfurtransferase
VANSDASSDGRRTYVAHYSEVALKGNNRNDFLRVLRRNIAKSLSGLQPQVEGLEGRLLVTAEGGGVEERLSKVFGVAWCSPASLVAKDYDSLLGAVLKEAKSSGSASFMVRCRRADKTYPMGSMELAAKLGAEVVRETGKKVDLETPGLAVHVDVMKSCAAVYSAKVPGPGGLPLGTSGRAMLLFSGGIDSPVAAWLLMKRGCRPVYVHFYLAPDVGEALNSKVMRLVRSLAVYGGRSTIVMVPFAEYQLATYGSPAGVEPSLFRRFMRMTAEAMAPGFGASAVATGDSLGQAASQTIWNIRSSDEGASLPVLRPLLSYDKDEIVSLARRIGTYDASLEEYKDCCSIVTRHPKTRTTPDMISDCVRRFDLARLVSRVVGGATLVSFDPRSDSVKALPFAQAVLPGPQAGQNYKQAPVGPKTWQE